MAEEAAVEAHLPQGEAAAVEAVAVRRSGEPGAGAAEGEAGEGEVPGERLERQAHLVPLVVMEVAMGSGVAMAVTEVTEEEVVMAVVVVVDVVVSVAATGMINHPGSKRVVLQL